jgi:hypothetical protein
METRRRRAGERVADLCRACKLTREHTVMAVDAGGRVLRVVCGFCGSEHNYRGGGDEAPARARPRPAAAPPPRLRPSAPGPPNATGREDNRADPPQAGSLPLRGEGTGWGVDERNRAPGMTTSDDTSALELLLRRVLREELGLTRAAPADKWRGGELVLRPGKPGLQEKNWPIDSFFHKIVMIRNRLRTLEQQLNASELPEDAKLRLQAYVTGCYGSLTSFNVLFADEEDQFHGSGSGE